ncbi:MAG: hypothetical protein HWD92_02645 [Flavobacteriia bacterium]|nr:hypothetical protein [Flavobacteriia bacterium]
MIKVKGCRVKLWTSVYSTKDETLDLLGRKLGHKDVESKMIKGQQRFNNVTKRYSRPWWATVYHFLSEYDNVFHVEECNKEWLQDWNDEVPILVELVKKHGYKVKLEYDIALNPGTYPSIEFSTEFLSHLAKFECEINMSFLHE